MTSEAGAELGPSAEQAWRALRLHTEWTQGFWVAWLFTDSGRVVRAFEARMQDLLDGRGRRQVVLRPRTPAEARDLLETILDGGDTRPAGEASPEADTRGAACVWVELLDVDRPGGAAGPWAAAWDWLMMRANERRGRLAGDLSGGLIFAAASTYKPRTAATAPDLWSIRSLVLEPEPPPRATVERGVSLEAGAAEESTAAPDVELARRMSDRMRSLGDHAGEATALMRLAQGLLSRCRLSAFADASGATTAAAGADHALLAEARDAAQRAVALVREAIVDSGRDSAQDSGQLLALLGEGLRVLHLMEHYTGHPVQAADAAQESVGVYRELAQQVPVRFLPDLAMSLYTLSNALSDAGRNAEALDAAAEAVDCFRSLADAIPFRFAFFLVIALRNLAERHEALGNHEDARRARDEAAELERRAPP